MKVFFSCYILLSALAAQVQAQAQAQTRTQLSEGAIVPEIHFPTLLNAPAASTTLSAWKGQAVLIEFWGTWCGSCIVAMPHLEQLQQQFGPRLRIIAVSDEGVDRIRKFLTVRPSKLWFAVDTAESVAGVFPHQMVPHTVLISPDGRLIATTAPENITGPVIDSVLMGMPVHLIPKKDLLYSSIEELIRQIFPADDTIRQRVLLDGEIEGAPGLSTRYATDSIWKGRRLTALNCDLSTLYRLAYDDFPYTRTVDQRPKSHRRSIYRVDLIVGQPADLLPTLKSLLQSRFDLRATIKREQKEVYLLQIADTDRFRNIPPHRSASRTFSAGHGSIDQQDITMRGFASYLESYGADHLPVLDETGSSASFDIRFNFQPENPQSLTDILTGMGLRLVNTTREIELLYIL
jgi:uncharacterized protein (TIGR03435 family)